MHSFIVPCMVLFGSLISACIPADETPSSTAKPNLLVILIDTLRKDRLGAYGYSKPTSPHIDALAARGVRFDRAYATAPWTLPSVCSLMSGLLPDVHRAVDFLTPISSQAELLPKVLHDAGYTTAAIAGNRFFNPLFGLDQGFDLLDQECLADRTEISSDRISDRAIAWLKNQAQPGFFLYLHYFDPHYNYFEHAGFEFGGVDSERVFSGADIWKLREALPDFTAAERERLQSLYDSEVAFTDHAVGRVLKALEESEWAKDTWVVLCADHGEELGDHGWIGHTVPLFEETVAIPLIITGPGAQAGVCDSLVQLHDLKAALLAVLGVRNLDAGPSAVLDALQGRARDPGISAPSRRALVAVETTAQPPKLKKVIERPPWRLSVEQKSDGTEERRLSKTDEPGGIPQEEPAKLKEIIQSLLAERQRDYQEKLARSNAAAVNGRAYVEDDYKLIWREKQGSLELYRLSSDPLERTNLALEQKDVVDGLKQRLELWTGELRASRLETTEMPKQKMDDFRRLLEELGYVRESVVERKQDWKLLLECNDGKELRLRAFELKELEGLPIEVDLSQHEDVSEWGREECEKHCQLHGPVLRKGRRQAAWIAWPMKLLRETNADGSAAITKLFNLNANPAETEDLSTERATLHRRLQSQLEFASKQPAQSEPLRFPIPEH